MNIHLSQIIIIIATVLIAWGSVKHFRLERSRSKLTMMIGAILNLAGVFFLSIAPYFQQPVGDDGSIVIVEMGFPDFASRVSVAAGLLLFSIGFMSTTLGNPNQRPIPEQGAVDNEGHHGAD